MNRVLVTDAFVEELAAAQESDELRKQLHSTVGLLAEDPIANSASAPYEQYADIRAISIGDYLLLFRFDPTKSEVYLLSLLRKSEVPVPVEQQAH
ncbi:MAG: type II toxin-antitoxin system RelE/ParE family toxin [Candidatus Sulfotelmatobacter sp.]